MHKLRLDLDSLAVESFDTASAGGRWGTVAAHMFGAGGADTVQKVTQSNCADCYYTLPATCMSCGEEVCTMASYTDCPSCYNSCNACEVSRACPVDGGAIAVVPVVLGKST